MKIALILTFLLGQIYMSMEAFADNAHNFYFEGIKNNKINLSDYKDKVLMVVNTASKCGFTNQYSELESLYKKYKNDGLMIIAVPSNDFANQEPGSDKDIQEFCKINYGVTFPVAKKVHVKGGDAHPFYKYAREKLGFFAAPKWNFHKYLIDKKGNIVDYYYSTTSPLSKKVTNKIEILLKEDNK